MIMHYNSRWVNWWYIWFFSRMDRT